MFQPPKHRRTLGIFCPEPSFFRGEIKRFEPVANRLFLSRQRFQHKELVFLCDKEFLVFQEEVRTEEGDGMKKKSITQRRAHRTKIKRKQARVIPPVFLMGWEFTERNETFLLIRCDTDPRDICGE